MGLQLSYFKIYISRGQAYKTIKNISTYIHFHLKEHILSQKCLISLVMRVFQIWESQQEC
jgi:hypothetical protein